MLQIKDLLKTMKTRVDVSKWKAPQKEVVEMMRMASRVKNSPGRRYSRKWVLQSLLMRIRGPALYNWMRRQQILPLPSRQLLNIRMRNLKCSYGFQSSLFSTLAAKVADLEANAKRGMFNLE